MTISKFTMPAALFAAASLGTLAHAQSYNYTQIQQPGSTYTMPRSINNAGVIVGFSGNNTSFKLENGSYTDIAIPNTNRVRARGINNNGAITGFLRANGSSVNQAFVLSGDVLSTTGVNGINVTSSAINDQGSFVGGYTVGGNSFAYKSVGGVATAITIPGQTTSLATGITNSGDVVGYYQNAAGIYNGFLEQNNSVTTLSLPGAYWTQPLGINNNGDIVGVYTLSATGYELPFVKTGNVYTLLNVPAYLSGGQVAINATDINDAGVIAGYIGLLDGSNAVTGYIATPIPGAAAAIALGGGSAAAPVVLPLSKVNSVSGAIGDGVAEQFYRFDWAGGAFSASLTLSGANPANSYQFQLCSGANCASVLDSTKLSINNWTGTLSSTLAAGRYSIGLLENQPGTDPYFTLSFATSVSSVPEPGSWAMMMFGFAAMGGVARSRRQRAAVVA